MMKLTRLIFFLAILFVASVTNAKEAKRPNIIFLFTDDQNTYSLGCYGNNDVVTPNIDSLARDGITFDRHYTVTAICMASRATVMTGLYEYRHGCNFGHGPLHQNLWEQSYPVIMREHGYLTAIAGKIGFEVLPNGAEKAILPQEDLIGGEPDRGRHRIEQNRIRVWLGMLSNTLIPHVPTVRLAETLFIMRRAKRSLFVFRLASKLRINPIRSTRCLIMCMPESHSGNRQTTDGSSVISFHAKVKPGANMSDLKAGGIRMTMTIKCGYIINWYMRWIQPLA